MKHLARLLALVMLLTAAPLGGGASAKQARIQQLDQSQESAPAQMSSPVENQNAGNGRKSESAAPRPQSPPPETAPAGSTLDKLSASLKQIETSLERQGLTDQDLQDMRHQIDPVTRSLAEVIDRLTPRLGEIKDRLDQLGPKPADNAPPESPAVTAERSDQQKLTTKPTSF